MFVLGIDALDLAFIKEKISLLPNFKSFMEDGTFGELNSTLPPITIPAWISMFTGKDPGKLDLYDFRKINRVTRQIELFNPLTYTKDLVWNMLPRRIERSIFNVPGSYPLHVHQVDEACTGFLSPTRQCKPASLISHFEKIEDVTASAGRKRLLKALSNDKVFFGVASSRAKDLTICVIRSLDVALHTEGVKIDEILQLYMEVDKLLSEIRHRNWDTIIVSDHGMKRASRIVYLNTILEKKGFLTRKRISKRTDIRASMIAVVNKVGGYGTRGILKRVNDLLVSKGAMDFRMDKADIVRLIDYTKTDAFAYAHSTSNYACIYVENKSKLNEIRRELEKNTYVDEVKRSNEIYKSTSEDTPDLIVKLKDDFIPVCLPYKDLEVRVEKYIHRKRGAFIAKGPTIRNNKCELNDLRIEDIAPTLLHMFGEKIPMDMDGRVLEEIFEEKSEPAKRKVVYTPISTKILHSIRKKMKQSRTL